MTSTVSPFLVQKLHSKCRYFQKAFRKPPSVALLIISSFTLNSMTPKTYKPKKSSSGQTTTLTTQEFWNRHRGTIIPKALAVHETFKSLGARWETIYQKNRSAWKEKQVGRQHLPQLVLPLWHAASLLTTRFKETSDALTNALGKGDGYKTTNLLKTMEQDANLMESILSSLEREMASFDKKKKVDACSKVASKKKKTKKTTKTIVEV